MSLTGHKQPGFGVAPLERCTVERRRAAAACVLLFLEEQEIDPGLCGALGELRSMFLSVGSQNRSDWFTTSETLGHPSARMAMFMATAIDHAQRALSASDTHTLLDQWRLLRRLPIRLCLRILNGQDGIADVDGAGWLYLFASRESPNLLAVGATTQRLQDRLDEINHGAGVVNPFGIRRCWRTREPAAAEREVHIALSAYVTCARAGFFKVVCAEASMMIDRLLAQRGLEMRTLDHLDCIKDR